MQKKKAHPYKYAEKCLYTYHRNLESYEKLSKELEVIQIHGDVRVQTYEIHSTGTWYSNPIERYINIIIKIKFKLSKLASKIAPLKALHENLMLSRDKDQAAIELIIMEEYYSG